MLAPLIAYIEERSSSPLTPPDIRLLREAFIPRKIKKREFLLRQGEICRYIAFIVAGAVRQYSVDEKGNEHVLYLCIENWWASDRESFHKESPSIYNIEAWEDSEVLLLPKADDYYTRVNDIPAFQEMRIKLDDNNHFAAQQRLHVAKSYPAAYRYAELTELYPEFLQRFPQHLIASYLGITKETLSRIRRQAAGK